MLFFFEYFFVEIGLLGTVTPPFFCNNARASIAGLGHADDNCHPLNVTTTFNLARTHEDAARPVEAEQLYRAILERHPQYVDCHLRLGLMAKARGRLMEAANSFKVRQAGVGYRRLAAGLSSPLGPTRCFQPLLPPTFCVNLFGAGGDCLVGP